MCKILLPHLCLLTVLLCYTAVVAAVLMLLEDKAELEQRRTKIAAMNHAYDWIINETWALRNWNNLSQDQWSTIVEDKLTAISRVHEGGKYDFYQEPLVSWWTFPAAMLYILTVLTTCGYDHVGPLTDGGRLFAVAWALIGIPLMFITAADIGKLLSEILVNSWKKSRKLQSALTAKLCRKRKTRKLSAASMNKSQSLSEEGVPAVEPESTIDGLWFPVGAYIVLVCLYCCIGAVLYMSWEDGWPFVHAFHFSFDLVITVGLGDIICHNVMYLILIVAYVIIGLAVVTMCIDLASSHLKAYFTKIHYFGRARTKFLGMSEEIREMMVLIAEMRKNKGGKVTWNDVQMYLKYEQRRTLHPYTPRFPHLLRYIDETSSAFSASLPRYASCHSDLYSYSSVPNSNPPSKASPRRRQTTIIPPHSSIMLRPPNGHLPAQDR